MSRRTPTPRNVARIRIAIVAVVAAIAVGLLGFGLWYVKAPAVTDTFVEGKHYDLLDDTAPIPPQKRVIVREYFSYYCVHCRNFDPIVEKWLESKPADVVFERTPVAFAPVWQIMGQAYYALAAAGALSENHPRLFRAIHDNGKQFPTVESIAEFVDGHGITREQFLGAFNAPDIHRAMNEASARAREQRVDSVPTLIVADRFRVNMDNVPRPQAFAVVDYLVAKARQGG